MGVALVTKCIVNYCQRRLSIDHSFHSKLYITNKTERFSYTSGHAMWVAKLLTENWPKVLQQEFWLKKQPTFKKFYHQTTEI